MFPSRGPAAAKARLALLAFGLLLLWFFQPGNSLDPVERGLYAKVRAAQEHLYSWRFSGKPVPAADPWKTGLIGLEWSPLTTTLGDLPAKRTACDPLWAVRFRRWYAQSGLKAGDRVAILASSSFPGLVLSAISAAESLDLDLFLGVSLGASTWGANDPGHPWPDIEAELRKAGFIRAKSAFYTLGGDGEAGGGIPPEGITLLTSAAARAGVPLRFPRSLEEAVRMKWESLAGFRPLLLVSVGGSHGNLGSDPAILDLPPGLLLPGKVPGGGNGVLGKWLDSGRPAVHALNIREMARREGIPFDSPPQARFSSPGGTLRAVLGLALFFGVLLTHRRWEWRDDHG
jgi:poly-gamma-glutamate system protein